MAKPKKEIEIENLEVVSTPKVSESKEFDAEQRALMSSPTGRFVVVQVSNGYKVAKNHQWISGVLDSKGASTLTSDMNRKDPEQKAYNRYLTGKTPAMRSGNDMQGLG